MKREGIKTHEIVTYSGRGWPLTEYEYKAMGERLEAGARFLTIPDEALSKVAVTDIKFFGKRQMSISDMIDESKALPAGEPVKFNPLGKGYIKFLAGSVKLAIKGKSNLSKVVAKITEEQKPLVNAELEKDGIDYRV